MMNAQQEIEMAQMARLQKEAVRNMAKALWRPIASAPKDRTIDIAAKHWNPRTDKFEMARFTDCKWFVPDPMTKREPHFYGVAADWRPVYWMEIPDVPIPWEGACDL